MSSFFELLILLIKLNDLPKHFKADVIWEQFFAIVENVHWIQMFLMVAVDDLHNSILALYHVVRLEVALMLEAGVNPLLLIIKFLLADCFHHLMDVFLLPSDISIYKVYYFFMR